jgi:hypothetical protein
MKKTQKREKILSGLRYQTTTGIRTTVTTVTTTTTTTTTTTVDCSNNDNKRNSDNSNENEVWIKRLSG